MSQTSVEQAEHRSFSVHPSIIKTFIHEQAGSPTKAVSEVVMNSVDAGARWLVVARPIKERSVQVRDDFSMLSARFVF